MFLPWGVVRGALHPGLLVQLLDVGAPLGTVLGEPVEDGLHLHAVAQRRGQ